MQRKFRSRRPNLDQLESRSLLSALTLTVNTLLDDPTGAIKSKTTLRDAINTADANTKNSYTIRFAVDGTIALTNALPNLNNNINIQGPGATKLTVARVSAAPGFSIFTVNKGVVDSMSGLTITGGNSGWWGNVFNNGYLTMRECTITNGSGWTGGGITNSGSGTLIVDTCAIAH